MPFYTDPVTKMEHKFACSHCIRGHRSTNCSHNDRPLFYIRKKGRPVSQCTQCRALRKNRSLHTRCECPSRVQNRGQGGNTSELADLPHGMTLEAAKEYVERLSMDQGGCRNCNSNRCQCDGRTAQSIAPASLSPVTTMPARSSSPYSLAFSPSFSSVAPSQIRNQIYSLTTPQHAALPQLNGIPLFANRPYQPSQISSLSSSSNPNIVAQVQQYQRRQEQLTASTQRRLQQESELRRRKRDGDNNLESISLSAQPQPPEFNYPHHGSPPLTYASTVHMGSGLVSSDHRLSVPQPTLPDPRTTDCDRTDSYRFLDDTSSSLPQVPYATTLSNTLLRLPPALEQQHPRLSSASFQTDSSLADARVEKSRPYQSETHTKPVPSTVPEDTSLFLQQKETPDSSTIAQKDAADQNETPSDGPSLAKGDLQDLDEEVASDIFPGLEKVFENWDAADNEWLYSLQTECAKPGAVCECGDSCCCPGCFTHTNNPGDRGVYNTILNKLGSILENENDEQQSAQRKPCASTLRSSINGTDAKL